jgi:ATP-dependent protease ClpP protease subunit
MSHEPSVSGEELRYSEAKQRRQWTDWIHKRWIELMARHTPQDEAFWKRTTERTAEYWKLGGEDIIAAGLADGIFGK